jgi:hypothetical protein
VRPFRDTSLTAHLERIKELAKDLALLREGDPARHTIADRITQETNAVLRAVKQPKP